jgi:hypothetical protein
MENRVDCFTISDLVLLTFCKGKIKVGECVSFEEEFCTSASGHQSFSKMCINKTLARL